MFRKKQKLVLEAYAPAGSLIDLFPITRASNSLPAWYESCPAKINGDRTVKQCPGLTDLYSNGIIIPAWADLEVSINPDATGHIKSGMNKKYGIVAEGHDLSIQAPGAWQGYENIKFINPWWLWCSEPIEWIWVQPTWSQPNPQEITLLPAITEFRYQHQANINTIIKKPTENKLISIKGGQPLAQLVPLTERDWELKLDVMTPEIFAKKFERWDFSLSLNTGYNKIRSIINRKK
jgi:hypothetical protein